MITVPILGLKGARGSAVEIKQQAGRTSYAHQHSAGEGSAASGASEQQESGGLEHGKLSRLTSVLYYRSSRTASAHPLRLSSTTIERDGAAAACCSADPSPKPRASESRTWAATW